MNSDRAGNQDLWLLPAEGGEMRQLTVDPTLKTRPMWSPDETETVFLSGATWKRAMRGTSSVPTRASASGEQNVLPEQASMRESERERAETPALEKSTAMHRFLWDLQHAGPWDSDEKRSGRDGPMAAPGTYQARLTVGDWTQTVSFETRMDPRIITEGTVTEADVTAQVELVLKARDALSSARRAATRLGKALEERPDDETLLEIKKALIPALPKAGSVWKAEPMILDQLVYLYQNRPATRPRRLRALRATGRRTSGASGKARCNRGSRTDRLE